MSVGIAPLQLQKRTSGIRCEQDEIVSHSIRPDWAQGPAQGLQKTGKAVRCSQGGQGNWAGCKDVPE
ncbi:hypothetical protein N7509_003119 [Penicillium cosmopolitanum]|uniref:Uncharacterized protein n=1 Tax=Penicillium cosmopolitanum TaxID=1131564 RepID=A0A9W9W4B0_9EURO|nr:uncharacterized protein N7509_003119 [Penicillium cosmopolitanum]KAJ5403248.1 hypothetical protein N7509_003119 [Penicillium cosmopolitanum]